jgi:hypothetical protein
MEFGGCRPRGVPVYRFRGLIAQGRAAVKEGRTHVTILMNRDGE